MATLNKSVKNSKYKQPRIRIFRIVTWPLLILYLTFHWLIFESYKERPTPRFYDFCSKLVKLIYKTEVWQLKNLKRGDMKSRTHLTSASLTLIPLILTALPFKHNCCFIWNPVLLWDSCSILQAIFFCFTRTWYEFLSLSYFWMIRWYMVLRSLESTKKKIKNIRK